MSNNLIDRGAVMIDYLGRLGRADSYKAKYEALAAAVDNAPAVDPTPKWISVEDRLPENDNPVLCWYLSGDGNYYHTVGICLRFTFGYIWDTEIDANDCGYGCKKVTHWMPLPEPPKEEEHHEQSI